MAGAHQLRLRPAGDLPSPVIGRPGTASTKKTADGADAAVVAWLGHCGPAAGIRRRVLKESSGRPVVQYRYTRGEGATATRDTVVAKGYYRGDGAATFVAMERLWRAGFSEDVRLSMPKPLAYLTGPRLLLQTRAAGSSLYRFLDDLPAGISAVKMTGRWLAKLHNIPLTDGPLLNPVREQERLVNFRDALTVACPADAARIRDLSDGVDIGRETSVAPLVPTHGDFQPKNVHTLGRRVSVIDFDRFAVAEPARDLGHFVAQSMTMSYVRTGSFEAIAEWNRSFLDAYAVSAPSGALTGLAVATVRSMLEILYYKLVVRPVRDPSFLGAWLDECDRCLSLPVS